MRRRHPRDPAGPRRSCLSRIAPYLFWECPEWCGRDWRDVDTPPSIREAAPAASAGGSEVPRLEGWRIGGGGTFRIGPRPEACLLGSLLGWPVGREACCAIEPAGLRWLRAQGWHSELGGVLLCPSETLE
ncbi:hypothetical protein NDU88_002058 [Pleurodeles waltl]|uniref:Uncharacterized protein n=1 Tax=Pleurodeles waltl TaxID=8319 RepID=A0AAV7WMM8_PLEWA|nr:hypothetical protein NDU88_002058 [Pleurodeles waltl]